MKLPKVQIKFKLGRAYSPLMLTESWVHGALSGGVIGFVIGMGDGKEDRWIAVLPMVAVVAILMAFEVMGKRAFDRKIAMLNEAKYMDDLFNKGIDVGSPNFTIAQIDADYR